MSQRHHRDELWLALIAAAVSIVAFLFYFRHNTLLLYGDAVAHINIARRVFDSRDPGPLQLGTVWLPLPHILMLPFVISRWMWRTGVGGAIPSMIAYVTGAVGLFRLVRRALECAGGIAGTAHTAAWFATGIYVANPNLLYLQATAMTEPLYLALFIWATVFFSEFVHGVNLHPLSSTQNGRSPEGWRTRSLADAGRSLRSCGILLLLCMLTRYDGWFAGAVFGMAAAVVLKLAEKQPYIRSASLRECGAPTTPTTIGFSLLPLPLTRGPFRNFGLLLVAVPVLWLVYNAAVWGNPLEFANGPYSAKGIEQRTATASMAYHPGYHSVKVASVFFLKDAKLNVADGRWEAAWFVIAAAGVVVVLLFARRLWPLLLLWVPLPFYALSISRGGVPIFIPPWWPHSYYNVRYGLQLLPAIAGSFAAVLWFVMQRARSMQWRVAVAAAVTFVGLSYASVWQNSPICLREARTNSLSRVPFERNLAREMERLPAAATVLMYVSDHVGALQQIGMPLSRTINETTHPYWKLALANPGRYADYAIAFGDDAVATAVKSDGGFEPVTTIESPGQPRTVIYKQREP